MDWNRRHFVGGAATLLVGGAAALQFDSTPARAALPLAPQSRLGPPLSVPAAPVDASEPLLLQRARAALSTHAKWIDHRDRIGLVDFSQASGDNRFQLINLESGMVEHNWLVAHGRGSDPSNTGYAKRFSNVPDSNASSCGAFLTANDYYGEHGHSRRLIGLEPQNNRAWDRAIVIHGADYVDAGRARADGRVGRSLGCFAVEPQQIAAVLQRLGSGRLLFAGTSA